MNNPESELERLGRAVTSARARLQEFYDSGQPDSFGEHRRLQQDVDQADAAWHQARRARPRAAKIGTWAWDFVRALFLARHPERGRRPWWWPFQY